MPKINPAVWRALGFKPTGVEGVDMTLTRSANAPLKPFDIIVSVVPTKYEMDDRGMTVTLEARALPELTEGTVYGFHETEGTITLPIEQIRLSL